MTAPARRWARWGKVGLGILLLGGTAAAASGYYSYTQSYGYNLGRLDVQVAYGANGCSGDYPMWMGITNGGTRTLDDVSVFLVGKRAGYSSVERREDYQSDRIIEPGQSYEACWSVTTPIPGVFQSSDRAPTHDALEWEVSQVRWARFR
ncbi:hypothetical protein [Flavimaricola marinus]|uniref:Uncharacterized protein n=1 Tax=Flavimaricola marinus TaxID=1819565 RepID=A0A238L9V8_9RHOB|nr:hypothetical protein [Flavimaricola marinus]SMY06469.1 hypothetical protein LOM8899_00594 [Flavimaricola marinus]